MLTQERARAWLGRWDRQQEYYIADREERFHVIGDVVEAAVERPDPLIVDLGVGPGSLATRLLARLPQARVVGIDADPLLLELGRRTHDERDRLRLVEYDVRSDGWVAALGLDRPADAIVSTTALHWLTGPELRAVYGQCAQLLRAGGVLVNGDHLYEGRQRAAIDRLTREIGTRRAQRVGARTGEDWESWWQAVGQAPEFAELLARRGPNGVEHKVDDEPTIDDHLLALVAAGFREVGTVWQHGADRVVVAVR